jgi:glycosyltransferase involved in cell wall biosynthesis
MLTVIVPVRNWPEERVAGCARSFLRLKSAALRELLIVDFGSDSPIQPPVSDPRLRTVRVAADIWSLAEAINIGVLQAEGTVLAKTDADILIAPEAGPALDRATKSVARGEAGLLLAQATDLPAELGVEAALQAPSRELNAAGRMRPRWGQGGLAIFSRSTWDAIGGFDSRFTGWGNEDNDFAERVRRSGRRVRWLERDAVSIFHVWHPPSFHDKGVAARRLANIEVAEKDRSTFRPLRIIHSAKHRSARSLALPNVKRPTAPLVTVAFASAERKNRLRMLKEAVRSFVGQADNDMEIIVADNGSSADEYDRLSLELSRLSLPMPLRPIRVETASIPAARNIITDAAVGRYICVADDDDIALPNRLADHLAGFQKDPRLHGSHGGWIDFDELTGVTEVSEGKERTLETLLFGSGKITAHPTCFYRTDVLRKFRYDEGLKLGSDLDLALRMASAGLRIAHTHSYVVLRRFHATNVTVTGLSNQVTNGQKSRRRLEDSLGPALAQKLAASAKTADRPAYCRNRFGRQRIIEMMPPYAGTWRLCFPLSALSPNVAREPARPHPDGLSNARIPEASPQPAAPALPVSAEIADGTQVGRVLEIVDGDVEAIASGMNAGFAFISRTIRGAARALRAQRQLAELDIEAELIADDDLSAKRKSGFDWSRLTVPKGARRLLSAPMTDPLAVLGAYADLPAGSVLRGMMSTISDSDGSGFRYFLVTGPLRGRDTLRSVSSTLRRFSTIAFSPIGNGGIVSDF